LNQLKATGADVDETSIKLARQRAKELVAVNREIDRQKAAMDELEHFADQASDRIGSAMTQIAVEGGNAWKDWRDIAKGAVSEVMQELVKLSVLNPLKNAIFNSNAPTFGDVFKKAGGGNGLVSTGGGLTGMFPWLKDLGGIFGFASGGRPPVGIPSIVGEKGPELFVPDVPGTVVPNNKLGQVGQSGPVFYVDNRGASVEAIARMERLIMQVQGSIRPIAIASVADARQRGLIPA
jgi:hypothetical protein